MPNLYEQLISFTKAMATQISAGCPMATKEEQGERHDICGKCPFLLREEYKCGVCSCKLHVKIPLGTSECPKGYWKAITGPVEGQ